MLNKKGFSLIELIVVIVVIAILIALGFAAINAVNKSSRNTQRKSATNDVKTALEAYKADFSKYPTGGSSLESDNAAGPIKTLIDNKYLKDYNFKDPSGQGLRNAYFGEEKQYLLYTALEGKVPNEPGATPANINDLPVNADEFSNKL